MFGIDTLQVGVVQLQYSTVLCCWLAGCGLACCVPELVLAYREMQTYNGAEFLEPRGPSCRGFVLVFLCLASNYSDHPYVLFI